MLKSQDFKPGQVTFLESLKSAVESVAEDAPDSRFNVTFTLQADQPWVGKSSSEVASLISVFARIVNQFDDTVPLTVTMDVVEQLSLAAKVATRTKEIYETKQALSQGVQETSVLLDPSRAKASK